MCQFIIHFLQKNSCAGIPPSGYNKSTEHSQRLGATCLHTTYKHVRTFCYWWHRPDINLNSCVSPSENTPHLSGRSWHRGHINGKIALTTLIPRWWKIEPHVCHIINSWSVLLFCTAKCQQNICNNSSSLQVLSLFPVCNG